MNNADATLQPDEVRTVVRESLARIAPDAEFDALDDDADLAWELRLDSMAVLDLLTAVAERTGVEVPARDLPQVATIEGWVHYLTDAAVAPDGPSSGGTAA
ncbi:MAG: acyl carrier protein [Actinomycetota bacterium]|nr:acyl carrier protein [Actinomycetota bacterium]